MAILGCHYGANRPDGWAIREDGTSYGTLIADLEVEGTDAGINGMILEEDPHCDGHRRIRTNEDLCRGVLGARFIGMEPKGRSTELPSILVSETPGVTHTLSLTPGYSQYGLR